MSSRRSGAVVSPSGTTSTASIKDSNNNNHHNHHDCSYSPSRNGKHWRKRRSMLDSGRLFLLRQRSRSPVFWKRFLATMTVLFVSTYTIATRIHLQKNSNSNSNSNSLRNIRDQNMRILYQHIPQPTLNVSYYTKMTGRQLLKETNNNNNNAPPKPLMVALVLVEEDKDGNDNDNKNSAHDQHHHHLQKLKRHDVDDTSQQRHHSLLNGETFQVIRIPHDDPSLQNVYQQLQKQHEVSSSTSKEEEKEDNKLPKKSKPNSMFSIQNVQWTLEDTTVSKKAVERLGNGVEAQEDIRDNSKDYKRGKPDPPPDQCVAQYDWQSLSFPNCNTLHELDLRGRVSTDAVPDEPEGLLLASGGYRDVWYVEQNHVLSEPIALKTLLYEHKYTERNTDRHRRDALATDRLTGSPYALNLYGYCANSGLYEYANGGSLEDAVEDEDDYNSWNASTKFKYAHQVVKAIADVHNIDKEGVPSMSHTDISMSQFVSTNDGIEYQINDFNRARFLYRRDITTTNKDNNKKDDEYELCTFEVGSNKGKFRSPEEYAYEPETAKIDVYSMGNILYVLLTGKYPFEDVDKKQTREYVMKGRRPVIPPKYLESQDPFEKTMVDAIRRCWIHKPEDRATSREIEQLFNQVWKKQQQQLHHGKHKHDNNNHNKKKKGGSGKVQHEQENKEQ